MPMWMQWWSSERPSPPLRSSSLALSQPPNESTTSSPWCSDTASPRLLRRRTRSTGRWAALSSSAPGWMPSCDVRTCSNRPTRSTGKAARHRPLSQPEPIASGDMMDISWGQVAKCKSTARLVWRHGTPEQRLWFPPLTGHQARAYFSHYGQPSMTSLWKGTYVYLQPPFQSLKGSSNMWSTVKLKAIYGPDGTTGKRWACGRRDGQSCVFTQNEYKKVGMLPVLWIFLCFALLIISAKIAPIIQFVIQ